MGAATEHRGKTEGLARCCGGRPSVRPTPESTALRGPPRAMAVQRMCTRTDRGQSKPFCGRARGPLTHFVRGTMNQRPTNPAWMARGTAGYESQAQVSEHLVRPFTHRRTHAPHDFAGRERNRRTQNARARAARNAVKREPGRRKRRQSADTERAKPKTKPLGGTGGLQDTTLRPAEHGVGARLFARCDPRTEDP